MDTDLGYVVSNIETDPPTKINVFTCSEKNEKKKINAPESHLGGFKAFISNIFKYYNVKCIPLLI